MYLVDTRQRFETGDVLALGLDERNLVGKPVCCDNLPRLLDDRRALDTDNLAFQGGGD